MKRCLANIHNENIESLLFRMPQSILVQVGQCGNQIGFNFWNSLLKEYRYNYHSLCENDFSQFLEPRHDSMYSSKIFEETYRARGILIDMEEGVINAIRRSSIGTLFHKQQILTDVSGSGNNWAVGHLYYGKMYEENIQELFRKQAETCDNLESFMFSFSLGGGTGSGLGTYALEVLADYYPKIWRTIFSVFPSEIDDVVTSPYNAALSNSKLLQYADMIILFENHAIENVLSKIESKKFTKKKVSMSPKRIGLYNQKPFDKMNNLIANTILNLTSCSRYPRSSNKTFGELIFNLLPDEFLKYPVPSIAPVSVSEDSSVDRLFNDVFSPNNCLFGCHNIRRYLFGASIFSRGEKLNASIVEKNLNKLQKHVHFCSGTDGAVSHGECKISAASTSASVVMLANSSVIVHNFQSIKRKLKKMYEKKAHLHHFTNEDPEINNDIEVALNKFELLIKSYQELELIHPVAPTPLIL